MSGYQQIRFYSPAYDADAVRISAFDARGSEFFAVVPVGTGAIWRERRGAVVDAVFDAIDRGDQPGQVTV